MTTLQVDTDDELFAHAVRIGFARYTDSLTRQDRDGARKSLLEDLMGAIAEAYCSRATGIFWNATVGSFRGGKADLGDDVEVRYTHHPRGGLLYRQGEPPERWYALVVSPYPPEWTRLDTIPHRTIFPRPAPFLLAFPGWMPGHEIAKHTEWKARPDPTRPQCWRVPQNALAPLPRRAA